MSKYKSVRTVADGIRFDSKAEAMRYGELKLLERCGKIKDLELQPAYVLVQPFTERTGKKNRGIKYIADFRYLDLGSNRSVTEDVKGVRTAVYRLKRTLLFHFHPDVNFVEVATGSART